LVVVHESVAMDDPELLAIDIDNRQRASPLDEFRVRCHLVA
jgi:hypothetical protein